MVSLAGKLIVIEGLDGSGKATQTKLLFDNIKKFCTKKDVIQISFPDYDQPSSSLVKMYLNGEFGNEPEFVNAYAASSFFAVDRYASYIKFWRKNYLSDSIILADRYSTSNFTYQMIKLKKDDWDKYIDWSCDYEYVKLGLPKPDVVIYLDMPPETSQALMSKRYCGNEEKKDLHERNIQFLKNCRKAALYSAKKLNWNVVNCAVDGKPRTISDIQNDILGVVKKVVF